MSIGTLIIRRNSTYTITMKIVFSGGGTAGHVTPNLALIDKLKGETIYYVGTDGMELGLVKPYVDSGKVAEYCQITAHKLQRKLTLSNLALPFQLIKSVKEAKKHLKRINPDVIFSKGGYVGLPVIIAGKMLKIPTIIHESDMSLGLANKICARFASQFLSAFPCDKRAKVVGLIIREEIFHGDKQKGLATMGLDGKKPVLLVTGGSLGAQALNEAIAKCKRLSDTFDIFVITGKNKKIDCDHVCQKEFVDNINDVLAATDVCLTRAGANTLAELTLAQVPFVTVPLTKCSRGEQVKNAEWFTSRGCGLMLSEEGLDTKLFGAINAAYDSRQAIMTKQRMRTDIYGTDKTVEIILNCPRAKS